MTRLKNVAEVIAGQSPPSEDVTPMEGGLPFLQGNAEFGPRFPSAMSESANPPKQARRGDILVSVRAPVGAVNLADQAYGIGRGLCAVRPMGIESRYAFWLLASSSAYLNSIATGSTFAAISAGDLAAVPIPVDSQRRQRRIAEFLDRETAQIDALIAKQQQLITTLAERVEARTVFAFTQAKSTTAPLASSVHSVLGPIPSGWGVARMKHVILSRRSGTSVNATGGPAGAGEVGVLKTSAVSTGRLDPSQNKLVLDPEEIARLQVGVRAGTILVNRANSPQLVGAAALVGENYPSLYLSDKLWELETTVHTGFLNAWMRTRAYRSQVEFCTVGVSSSMLNLAFEDFKEFYIPLPSAADQARVCSEIEELERTADAVTSAAQAQIALSRERRQALISAAVTGKIDLGETST